MMEIKKTSEVALKIEMIETSKIQMDPTNPNKMSDDQFNALKKNIKKYGFIVPLITNKEYIIADGEHRFLAAKSLGMKKIPTVVLSVNDIDRRILRQVMNKLKGSHELYKDLEDYKLIVSEGGSIDFLRDFLAKEDDEIQRIVKMMQIGDSDMSTLRGNQDRIYISRTIQLTEKESNDFDRLTKPHDRAGSIVVESLLNYERNQLKEGSGTKKDIEKSGQ